MGTLVLNAEGRTSFRQDSTLHATWSRL